MIKKDIAKLLHKTPNVSATLWEIVYFFHTTSVDLKTISEGDVIEEFLQWRGDLDRSLEENRQYYEDSIRYLRTKYTPSKPLPKKVIKEIEEYQKDLDNTKMEDLWEIQKANTI